jgi:hypothetical protein
MLVPTLPLQLLALASMPVLAPAPMVSIHAPTLPIYAPPLRIYETTNYHEGKVQ